MRFITNFGNDLKVFLEEKNLFTELILIIVIFAYFIIAIGIHEVLRSAIMQIHSIFAVFISPLIMFGIGWYIWINEDKNSVWRIFATWCFWTVGVFQAIPWVKGTDWWWIYGLNPPFFYGAWILMFSTASLKIAEEVMDKKYKKTNKIVIVVATLIFFSLTAIIHEYGHYGTAKLLGCEASTQYYIFGGITTFECTTNINMKAGMIALAGGFVSFVFGFILWYLFDKDSIMRILAMWSIWLSGLFQLMPWVEKGDAWQYWANFNQPIIIPYLLFAVLFTIGALMLGKEFQDEEFPSLK